MRLPLELTPGLVSAHSPSWLRNRHRKLSRCRLKNHHQNYFPSWRLVSSAHTIPVVLVIITENLADDLEIINETASRVDAWIGQRTQSQLTQKSTPKTESLPPWKSSPTLLPSWHLVSSMRTVPIDSIIVTENRLADDSEIINKTAYTAEAWIRPCTESLLTR